MKNHKGKGNGAGRELTEDCGTFLIPWISENANRHCICAGESHFIPGLIAVIQTKLGK